MPIRSKKKATVHRLTTISLGIGEPIPEIVDALAGLLERAKRGEISGLAVALVRGNNTTATFWESGCASVELMVASVSQLNHRINAAADGEADWADEDCF